MTVAVDLGLGNPLTRARRFIAGMPYRAPIGSGSGYLAGEFPDGITTVEGVPVSATVRILYRPAAGALGDGVVVAEVQSEPNGSWQVAGLNPDLRYDVVGRLEGRNDVIMAGVSPMRTDIVTYEGELVPNEEFDGMAGFITLLDGMPPFTVSGTQGMPAGLFTVVDGRKMLIDGTTSENGEWEAEITIQDANSNTVNIPVVIPIGFDAPSDIATSYSAPNNEVTLTWKRNSYVEEGFYIYRSGTEMDMNNLPEPIASVGKGVTQFIDDDVSAGSSYYYVVAAFYQDITAISGQVAIHLVNRPTVADVATTFIGSNETTHPVNLPNVDVGDLMVMLFAYDDSYGVQIPDGWTLLGDVVNTSDTSAAVFYKVADAEDGSSVTVTTIRSERSSAIVYRYVKDSFGEQLEMSPPEAGNSANPAAPSFAHVSGHPCSAIAFYSQESRTPSGPVFPYPDWRAVPTTGGSNTNIASCAACITDVEVGDVPEFEYQIDTSRRWIAFSVVVPPK